jgi:RNA-directed DNA polymerase
VKQWRESHAAGDCVIVRYADDFVMGFQHKHEAELFMQDLKVRLEQFGLSLHPDKTRLIEFGRYAGPNRRKRGEGKPETFDFQGFTHICDKRRKDGGFVVTRKTMAKRLRARLRKIWLALKTVRYKPIMEQGQWLQSVVRGYLNYHAVPGNKRAMDSFRYQVKRYWLLALRGRSQKHRMTWDRFERLEDRWLPRPTILHPYPNVRFHAIHPR